MSLEKIREERLAEEVARLFPSLGVAEFLDGPLSPERRVDIMWQAIQRSARDRRTCNPRFMTSEHAAMVRYYIAECARHALTPHE